MSIAWPSLDGDGGVEAGDEIGDGDAHFHRLGTRRPIGLTRDAHEPAHALNEIVVARFVLVRTVMTEARQRAIDEARILRRQGIVIEAVAGERAGLEVLDDDMGAPCQPFDERRPFGLREIDGDGALVAVGGKEIGGVAALKKRRPEGARLVALARLFDLQNLGAQIAQDLRGPRSRQHAAQIEDSDMRQRAHGERP
jgi:hypothetical protein